MKSMAERNALLHLWGKKKGEPPCEVRYPLLLHMLDVAMVAQQLWNRSLHSGAKHFFADRLALTEPEAGTWVSFSAGLHDIGKASPVFQRKSQEAKRLLEMGGATFDRFVDDFPHGGITAWAFPALTDTILQPTLPAELSLIVGRTVGGHHGVFPSGVNPPGPRQRGDSKWDDMRSELATSLAKLLNASLVNPPRYVNDNAFYIALAGLTTVSDWIASNEQFFPYQLEQHEADDHLTTSRRRAQEAVQRIGWAGWAPPTAIAPFQQLFSSIIEHPRPLQSKTVEVAESLGGSPSLVIIEAPMGEGKTEAAMYLADYWAVKQGQKGCYFALPTQATSNQMLGRVAKFLEARYPGLSTNLQLIHGAALLSEDFADMRMRLSSDGDSVDTSPEVSAAEWFLPKKRGLLAPFGVGTIDQALLSVLQTKHFFVRLFGLAQKTVIIDEVHAYDTYMSTLLERLIAWLHALGSSVVLLSATLPANKRLDLIRAYGGDTKASITASYPTITWVSNTAVHSVAVQASQQVKLHVRQVPDDLNLVVDELRNSLSDGGCVAIVCNTVKRAQETYAAIKRDGWLLPNELMLLHSRYPFEDRERREKNVLTAHGKEGKRPKRALLVATQIIEQSLDVDFDLMLTDLAPVDLVIQRAGRIHRHDHNIRPKPMSEPTLWIRMPDTNEDGLPELGASAYVYDTYFLLLSYLYLSNCSTISFPGDIQCLIEKVYGEPQGPWPSAHFENAVWNAKASMEEQIKDAEFRARVNLVPNNDAAQPLQFFADWNKELEEDAPELHRSLQALTRLADLSVQVVCLHKSSDGHHLHDNDGVPLDINKVPQDGMVNALLKRSMAITDKRVVFKLIAQKPPQGWNQCAPLRHHRLLDFENGLAKVDKYLLRLDEELGLHIEDPAN